MSLPFDAVDSSTPSNATRSSRHLKSSKSYNSIFFHRSPSVASFYHGLSVILTSRRPLPPGKPYVAL
ncbi:hypothetical protein Y032_0010g982 [Ancylostoma ceylanicum]|uniref:Uncharacterized protein n=1 Tax=Ancylostoma ceylanicum TaxID=53326 RepID=A0A016VHN9_9BILA|nr:hypothetical protein Y032_0010g982 [Ancylostoma ceylanicum]